jgi:hypothetical protein
MRQLYTTKQLHAAGKTRAAIRWAEKQGRLRLICRGVWAEGPDDPCELDRVRADLLASDGVACDTLAAFFHQLDAFDEFDRVKVSFAVRPGSSVCRRGGRRRTIRDDRIVEVNGVRCTDVLQTLLDLAVEVDDLLWEQALEYALRHRQTTIEEIEAAAPGTKGAVRIRRVLALRPPGAPPTDSILETMMVQLARTVPGLPPPTRQYIVKNADDQVVAKVDLAWPELGIFLELDGEGHKGQPRYDSRRQTRVIAITGWLVGRFTWHEVVHTPKTAARDLAALLEQAQRRAS